MGVIIFNKGNDDQYLSCNWWNWRPTVELMRPTAVLSDELFDLLSDGIGELEKDHCMIIVDHFVKHVFPGMEEEARFLLNGEKTLEEDDGTFHRVELEKNYSASAVWLKKFVEFLRESNGISVS